MRKNDGRQRRSPHLHIALTGLAVIVLSKTLAYTRDPSLALPGVTAMPPIATLTDEVTIPDDDDVTPPPIPTVPLP